MFNIKKMPKARPFKEFHLKRMAHMGYVVITKTSHNDDIFIVIECNMNGHWYSIGLGRNGTSQWWPSLWHNATTKTEVENDLYGHKYEFFDSFDELRIKHGDLVKSRVLTQAPNDFTEGKYSFCEDLPLWKEALRRGWSYKQLLDLNLYSPDKAEIEAYINGDY